MFWCIPEKQTFPAVINKGRTFECLSFAENMAILSSENVGIPILRKLLLKPAVQEHKHSPGFILKGILRHLLDYNQFTRDINQY